MLSQLPQCETEYHLHSLPRSNTAGEKFAMPGLVGEAGEAARLLSLHRLRFCSSPTTLG